MKFLREDIFCDLRLSQTILLQAATGKVSPSVSNSDTAIVVFFHELHPDLIEI